MGQKTGKKMQPKSKLSLQELNSYSNVLCLMCVDICLPHSVVCMQEIICQCLLFRNSGVSKHKAVIGSLAANDPEFYKFLQEEDKNLLNFDDSSDEEEVHKLPSNLVEQQVSQSDTSDTLCILYLNTIISAGPSDVELSG